MHFLSLRHLKDKRDQKEDQQAQQIPWGSQTFPWKLQSPCSWPEPLCAPRCRCGSEQVGGQGDVERAQPPGQAGPRPCGYTDGLILVLHPAGKAGRKPRLQQIITRKQHKITKAHEPATCVQCLTFSVTAAQVQQLSRQLGSC